MKITQTRIVALVLALLAMPFALIVFSPQSTSAYTCVSSTNGVDHVYKDGGCYKGTELQPNEQPVHNDGTPIEEWTCPAGDIYNTAKRSCETCGQFGGCRASANKPTPKGPDTTVAIDESADDEDGTGSTDDEPDPTDKNKGGEGECAGVKTDYFACEGEGVQAASGLLQQIMLIMTVGVGIVAVGGIVYGAILYASAQDNREQVQKAVKIIRSVGIGILLYLFMAVIINWLVPGGVFNTPAPAEKEETSEETTDEDAEGGSGDKTTDGEKPAETKK